MYMFMVYVQCIFFSLTKFITKKFTIISGPNLRVVGTMSAGYDHIDVQESRRRGIKVGYTPHVLTAAVAEIAVTLLLEVARRVPEGRDCIKKLVNLN
jgi:glyoxylate/hydroxypyruvate reductase